MSTSKRHIRILLLSAAALTLLLAGCERVDGPTPQPETQEEIRLNAAVWQMMQGAPSYRISPYTNANLSSDEYGFTCYAYTAGTTEAYINGSNVRYISSEWQFQDGKHYWPASGALDFFTYMPATPPAYISDITYAVSGEPTTPHPYFVCANLPMTDDGQPSSLKEFIYAVTPNQSKVSPGASGVTMSFKHPFALIKFAVGGSDADITIKEMSFSEMKTGGTCTFDGSASTWSDLTGSATLSITEDLQYGSAKTQTAPFLVIPNNYGDKTLTVKVSWTDWGEQIDHYLTTTVDLDWDAGKSYTYTLNVTKTDLIVNTTKYTEQW